MMGSRSRSTRANKDEAEKPFWISFADLMTALMVLFLVVMAVALLAVTRTVSEKEKREAQFKADVDDCISLAVLASKKHEGVKVDLRRRVIDFGDRARFNTGSADLTEEQEVVLRRFVPELLEMSNMPSCQRVLKRIVVEGFTDKHGTYLKNLNLSLKRSERVLCAMFQTSGPNLLTQKQKMAVRDVFLVGGFAFNGSKETTDADDRRVEMRLEFLGMEEKHPDRFGATTDDFGTCKIL